MSGATPNTTRFSHFAVRKLGTKEYLAGIALGDPTRLIFTHEWGSFQVFQTVGEVTEAARACRSLFDPEVVGVHAAVGEPIVQTSTDQIPS